MSHFHLTDIVERLGWLLVHSVWQFALIAMTALLLERAMRRASSSARYWMLLGALGTMLTAPVATWAVLPRTESKALIASVDRAATWEAASIRPAPSAAQLPETPDLLAPLPVEETVGEPGALLPPVSEPASAQASEPIAVPAVSLADAWSWLSQQLQPWLSSLVVAWCIGVLAFAVRPILSWYTVRRLRTIGVSPVPEALSQVLSRVASRLRIHSAVTLLQSTLVQMPCVVGYFRPVVLLPVSVVSGLAPAQLEAILVHELAHIRRHDYLVNLLQTLVETIFFYHPAIWWISHRIRCERENCCDDLAVAVLGNKVEYGRALLALEQRRGAATALAVGAGGGSLLDRVRRLFGFAPPNRLVSGGSIVGLTLLAAVVIGVAVWTSSRPAAIAADDADDKEISRLVKQLGEDDIAKRDAATKGLVEIGEPALGALNKAQTTGDPEVRFRAEEIITAIENKLYPELILKGHGSSVWRVCLSADGKRLVTCSGDRTLKLWDTHSGECLQIFKGHTDRALCAALSPDGKRMLSGGEDRTVRLWDRATGKELLKMTGHTAKLQRVAFLPEDQALSQGEGDAVRLWDLNTGKNIGVFAYQTEVVRSDAEGGLRSVAGGDKARLAATTSRDTSLGLRDLETGKVVRTIPNLGNDFHNVGFSADGKRLLSAAPSAGSADENNVRISDAETGQELFRIHAPNADLVAFSPDGKLIVTGMPLRVWDVATRKPLRTYDGHFDGVTGVRFFPDSRRIVSTSFDGSAHIWRAPELKDLKQLTTLNLAGTRVTDADLKEELADLKHLTSLNLYDTRVTDAGLKELADLKQLTTLDLSSTGVTDAGMKELSHLKQLTTLKPGNVTDAGLKELKDLKQLTSLHLAGAGITDAGLAELKDLKQLTLLSIDGGNVTDAGLAELKELKQLATLYLGSARLTGAGFAELKDLKQLTSLDLQYTGVTDAGLAELAHLKQLTYLNLSSCYQVTDAGLKELKDLKQLTTLYLSNTRVTDAGLKELKDLKQLTSLSLGSTGVTRAGVKELQAALPELKFEGVPDPKADDASGAAATSGEDSGGKADEASAVKAVENLYGKVRRDDKLPGKPVIGVTLTNTGATAASLKECLKELKHLKQLTSLNLEDTQVTDAGLAELADLKQLASLDLFSTQVTDAGLKELKDLKQLASLELAGNQAVTDAGLAELKDLKQLTSLSLGGTQVTDAGLKELTDFKQLTALNLNGTGVTDAGLKELTDLKQLTSLSLSSTQVTDAGLKELADLKQLTYLSLYGTKVTPAGVKELQAALPELKIDGAPDPKPDDASGPAAKAADPVRDEQEAAKPLPKDPEAKAQSAAPAADIKKPVKKPGAVFKAPGSHTHDVALSPDGKILARAGTGQAELWDVASGKQLHALKGNPHFYKVAFSPDGKTLGSITGEVRADKFEVGVKLWDVATGKERVLGKGAPIEALALAFSPDGHTLATSSLTFSADAKTPSKTVKLWDVATGKEKMEFGGVWGTLAFSPDGKTLAIGDSKVHLWDLTTGKKRVSLARAEDWVDVRPWAYADVLSFSPDGKTLVSAGLHKEHEEASARLTVWDVATAKERTTIAIPGYSAPNAPPVVFTADSKSVITAVWIFEKDKANQMGRVSVQHWDLATGKARATYWTPVNPGGNHPEAGHVVGFYYAALSADGKTVAWGGAEGPEEGLTGTAHVWEVQSLATSPPKIPKELEEAEEAEKAERKEVENLRGTWKLRAVEVNGRRQDPKHLQTQMRIEGYRSGPEGVLNLDTPGGHKVANYRIDASRQPKTIDIVISGELLSTGNRRYTSVKAIYLLEGDRLTICRGRERTIPEGSSTSTIDSEPRPTEFKTQPDDGLTLEIYERVPPAPPDPYDLPTFIKPGETKTVTLGYPGNGGGPLQWEHFNQEFTLTFADTDVPKGVTFEPANPVVKNPGEVAKFTIRAAQDAALGDFAIQVTALMKGGHLGPGGGFMTCQLDLSVDPAGEAAREPPGKPRRRYRRLTDDLFITHDGKLLSIADGQLVMKSKDGTEHSYTLPDKFGSDKYAWQISYNNSGYTVEELKALLADATPVFVRVTAKKAKPQEPTYIEAVYSDDAFMAEHNERERQKKEQQEIEREKQEIERQQKVQQEIDHLQGTWLVVSSETGDEKEPEESLQKQRVIIKGDHLTLAPGNERSVFDSGLRNEKREGTFKIDPQAKSLDWVIPKAGDAALKAIYELQGDDLKIGFGMDNLLRPTRFEMGQDQVGWLLVLKREREDAQPAER